jgi:hypothetical protein
MRIFIESLTFKVGAGFILISAKFFYPGGIKKRTSNIERPTSNFQWEKMKKKELISG